MAAKPRIYLATDHAGYRLKEAILEDLVGQGYDVTDFGAQDENPSDYPDYVIPAAEAVAASKGKALGVVFGGSGNGECIAANKVRGVRAALAYDEQTAALAREHNDANVLCLGGRMFPTKNPKRAAELVRIWLKAKPSRATRHLRRLKKIASYEKKR